ncbi:YceD family protein [Caldibacillus lycopersici]|uniref:YceD family protein n=1 Tax=Perspicuibacillus lycopersici TaxID=1325689 RepID=A0AAE3IPI4_9BACI|nr:YceD family protein [Perspicuibacillus lycopersici]
MKWSMTQLQKFRNKGLEIDEVINLDSIKNRDPQIRSISPIRVKSTVDITSKEVTFHLHITGELVLPSSRTLNDVHYPIDIHSVETFLYDVSEYDIDPDGELHLIQGEMVDLLPVIEELILIEIPLQVLGDEDEDVPASLQSGKDWEYISEEEQHQSKKIDPRLAELAKLLNQDDE